MFFFSQSFFVVVLMVVISISTSLSQSAKLPDDLPSQLQNAKLSEGAHFTDLDADKREQNPDFDHDAFLGKNEADKFKKMSLDESKAKLGQIVENKINTDMDDLVSLDEMHSWIKIVHKKEIEEDVESSWKQFNKANSLQGYLDAYWGAMTDFDWSDEEKTLRAGDYKTYKKLMDRSEKRFRAADADNDDKLTLQEYTDFLHPEESKQMRGIVINETLEDSDTNQDGVISLEEFLKIHKSDDDDVENDELLKHEEDNFHELRDKNKDGVMDRDEVADWILPDDFDHSLNEAHHLIYEADENKDGKLSKEEILENHSLFVASQATGYGRVLEQQRHEDL